MKLALFKEKVKQYPLIKSSIFPHITDKPDFLRKQVTAWVKKDYLTELKRGMYTLTDKAQISRFFIANQLYPPSYISLESALSFYGLIPEKVSSVTSISSKKTQTFANSYGEFHYHHLKVAAYNNFVVKKDEFGNSFFIAIPEKALLDFFYFKMRYLPKIEEDIFSSSFRLQNIESLNTETLASLVQQFRSQKLTKMVQLFIKAKRTYD